jgi:hypothetical protein
MSLISRFPYSKDPLYRNFTVLYIPNSKTYNRTKLFALVFTIKTALRQLLSKLRPTSTCSEPSRNSLSRIFNSKLRKHVYTCRSICELQIISADKERAQNFTFQQQYFITHILSLAHFYQRRTPTKK